MATRTPTGRVASLFAHVKDNWCQEFFDEMYVCTNGDCIEDAAITEDECTQIESIPCVQRLFRAAAAHERPDQLGSPGLRILDLCCGQGRHSIALATRHPRARILGVDQSEYLIQLARQRSLALGLGQVEFKQSDARQILAPSDTFDLVMVMGHSLGCLNDSDGAAVLKEISRVVRPGGSVIIEIPNSTWLLEHFSPSGWEWLDEPNLSDKNEDVKNETASRQLIACRERELSPDKKRMASREIVIDVLSGSVLRDQFYAVRLYSLDEMSSIMTDSGLQMRPDETIQVRGPQYEGTGDAGMLEARQIVVAMRPPFPALAAAANPQDALIYVHPHLQPGHDPLKGKMLRASASISAGTVILADVPYAMVPIQSGTAPRFICSNVCCRKLVSIEQTSRCPRACADRVNWCDDECRAAGELHHQLECTWLKEQSELLRVTEGEYDFTMLWMVLRLLIGRLVEMSAGSADSHTLTCDWEDRFQRGWQSFSETRSNLELWPRAQLDRWRRLIDTYLTTSILSTLQVSAEEALVVLCQEETNSFWLHDGVTGTFPVPEEPQSRGEPYALAVYPRACGFNHSCSPNVRKPPYLV